METQDINEAILESLYAEALLLADETRGVFDLRVGSNDDGCVEDSIRLALSIEGLRTTTRVMHMLAWLLNHRAFMSGELSESQLRRHGALAAERPSDPEQLMLLEPETRSLIRDTERLYTRIARLDHDWREQRSADNPPIAEMRGRIAEAFARS